MRTIAILLFVACAPRVDCPNPCGMSIESLPDGWLCSDVVTAQAGILYEMADVDSDKLHVCELGGFTLKTWDTPVRKQGEWTIGAQTNCQAGTMEIGNLPPQDSSFAHELVHAMQGCHGFEGYPTDPEDKGHEGWIEQGIYERIDRVTSGQRVVDSYIDSGENH